LNIAEKKLEKHFHGNRPSTEFAMPAENSKDETGKSGGFQSDRFRVESVRPNYLEAMPEAPSLEEDAAGNNVPPPRKLSLSSILEPPASGLKRLWSRRRSSVNPGAQLTLSHYLTKEVVPNLDNYRLSIGGAGSNSRPNNSAS
jgi:hypothetical protein